MKRLNIALYLLVVLAAEFAYSQDYYWYKGSKISLQRGKQEYILYRSNDVEILKHVQIIDEGDLKSPNTNSNLKWATIQQENCSDFNNYLYKTPSYKCPNNDEDMYVTHRFYVKLKNQKDYETLVKLASKYNAEIEEEGDFPLWFILKCSEKSKQNALELANVFYESKLFATSEPEFINAIQTNCATDPYFPLQWNLYNSGIYNSSYKGIDIKYCDAHSITTGDPSIIIGLFDFGVDLSHPDLNLHPYSYDAHKEKTPNKVTKPHGTACAGIISAKSNNIGTSGIAPSCPIMSFSLKNATCKQVGKAYKIAADKGCSVINNSWGGGARSEYIEEGISYALTHGRKGKGCVVVFASGNTENGIGYPANTNESIIVVGAISLNGKRKSMSSNDGEPNWGSCYGYPLDIMAPGIRIPTTDIVGTKGYNRTDYNESFNGTSAAAPHVSAVAGLILSINPELSQKEVADIIESTAQKIGNYKYEIRSNRPNGTWNGEMGYGLVDAKEAVKKAQVSAIMLRGSYSSCTTSKFYLTNCSDKDYNITWTLTNNGAIQNVIEGYSSDKDTVYIHPKFAPGHGNNGSSPDVLTATISNPDGTIVLSNSVTLHPQMTNSPHISVDINKYFNATGTIFTFSVDNCPNVPDEQLEWTLEYIPDAKFAGAGFIVSPLLNTRHYTGRSFSYTANPAAGTVDTIKVTVRDTKYICENASETQIIPVIGTRKRISLKATEIGSQLNVSIMEETEGEAMQTQEQAELNENSEYSLELWNAMLGRMKTQPAESANEQINTSGMPQGVYSVSLKENGEIVAQTKVMLK